ncbi:MAG: cobalamin-binding protein [Eubacteriaceae bacterium]|jgi:methanogenic corrinoid protein MtbC1|nr:cobalamin-binding protein [Eubacteriaceae bacterium]
MVSGYDYTQMIQMVVDGEGDDVLDLVDEALESGESADAIIEKGLVEGMKIVSDKYDKKEFFVPDLAAAADAMSDALDELKPHLEQSTEEVKGTIVIGVVQECSQEIGKNIVSAMLSGGGFRVHDIGINVTPKEFIDKAKEVHADIIALGCPMLQTVKYIKETVDLAVEENIRDQVKFLIGGASTNPGTVADQGADGWGKDGSEAVDVALKLMEELRK